MDAVGSVRRARCVGQRVHARCVLLAPNGGHDIGLVGGHDGLNALDVAQRRDVVLGETERREHPYVHERGAVVEFVGRGFHVGSGHAQTGVEPGAERDDGRDS